MSEPVILCAAGDVVEGEIRQAPLPDGTFVALYRVDGTIYATADMCTHGEASLSAEGIICGKTVECTFHFGTFDVTTVRGGGPSPVATDQPSVIALRKSSKSSYRVTSLPSSMSWRNFRPESASVPLAVR